MQRIVVFLVCLLVSVSACQAASVAISKLANTAQWKKLLHFESGDSEISSDDFFIAPTGRHNPELELFATISSMSQPLIGDPNLHAQCRYPARKLWLQKQLGANWRPPKVVCPQFLAWKESNQTESISLIFVSGYLGNPASFFGHLLLKLNKANPEHASESPLLDKSFNYGADAHRDDNPVKYVTYGLLGGYDASFSTAEYYQLEYGYAENEQRELWEYELNLSEQEVRLLEAHLWELSEVKFTYLFLSGNCSTEMAKLVGIVLDEGSNLLTSYQPWDMPLDIFKSLAKTEHNGRPLIKAINKRDSKYTRIYDKYSALTTKEKSITQDIVKQANTLDEASFEQLNIEAKQKILSLLFDFYQLEISENGSAQSKEMKRRLMLKSLAMPAAEIQWPEQQAEPPHLAQNPNRVNVSIGHNGELGSVATLSYRAGYYDFLAREVARYKNSNAVFFSTEVKAIQNKAWLSKFDLFDVTTLNILHVDLFEKQRWAWSGRFTYEQKDLSTTDEERLRLYASMGWATHAFEVMSFYALPELKTDFSKLDESTLGVKFGALYTASTWWKTHLLMTPTITLGTESFHRVQLLWDNRFGDSQNWDLRLKISHDIASEINLSYSLYF